MSFIMFWPGMSPSSGSSLNVPPFPSSFGVPVILCAGGSTLSQPALFLSLPYTRVSCFGPRLNNRCGYKTLFCRRYV